MCAYAESASKNVGPRPRHKCPLCGRDTAVRGAHDQLAAHYTPGTASACAASFTSVHDATRLRP